MRIASEYQDELFQVTIWLVEWGRNIFIDVNIRYHCPIMCLIRSDKNTSPCYKRKIWLYDKGNYQSYRQMFSEVDWDIIINDRNSIDVNTQNLSNKILQSANENIPNKIITVRHNDLPWLNNEIRRLMRKRNRAKEKLKRAKLWLIGQNLNSWEIK